jgi:cyclophilin family peptidyl-prolyl cis-trans isomerase
MKKNLMLLTVFMVFFLIFLSMTPYNINAAHLLDNDRGQISTKQNIKSDFITYEHNPYAIIETSMGTIKIELYKDLVPNTVDNFIKLVKDDFYNGLVFHRVIDNFVIQGGGHYPNGTIKLSPYRPIDLEIHPKARHVDGAIGMARTSDPNSATSQFYICDGAQHQLDDEYAVFGKVTIESLRVIRNIAAVATTTKYGMPNWPVDTVMISSVVIKVKSNDIINILNPATDSLNSKKMDNHSNLFLKHQNLLLIMQKLSFQRFPFFEKILNQIT